MPNVQLGRPPDRNAFEIAIFCALIAESRAVEAIFDEFYEDDALYNKVRGEHTSYTLGRIGNHHVVLAYLSGMGKGTAASMAGSFRAIFPDIKLGLLVGICGAIPTAKGREVLLGDIIISTGVVQYDLGRQLPHATVRKNTLQDNLSRPNYEIRSFLSKMQGIRGHSELRRLTSEHATNIANQYTSEDWGYPGRDHDRLFSAKYRHKHQDVNACNICAGCLGDEDAACEDALHATCEELGCDLNQVIPRQRLDLPVTQEGLVPLPGIHFGYMASGDLVMRSAIHRDRVAKQESVIGFEMEGAGIWDNFPCLIVKSVCDYADTHKNKGWQSYAALSAAACTKALLKEWRSTDNASVRRRKRPKNKTYSKPVRAEVAKAPEKFVSLEDALVNETFVPDPESTGKLALPNQIRTAQPRLVTELTVAINLLRLIKLKVDMRRTGNNFIKSGNENSRTVLNYMSNEALKLASAIISSITTDQTPDLLGVDTAMIVGLASQCDEAALVFQQHLKNWDPYRHGIAGEGTFENVDHRMILDSFLSTIAELSSATSKAVAESLRTSLRNVDSAGDIGYSELIKDIRSIIRIFHNDSATMDTLIGNHGDVLGRFWVNNMARYTDGSDKGSHSSLSQSAWPSMQGATSNATSNATSTPLPEKVTRDRLDEAMGRCEATKRGKLLRNLNYRQISDREEEVAVAYPSTFNWIFNPNFESDQWDDFPTFLQQGEIQTPFWINGKAGSGKSTLMKYLANHEKLQNHLKLWSPDKEVVVASFFFWNVGSEIQKSVRGLLMSVLYQILSSHPDLIRSVFEEIWPEIESTDFSNHPLSYPEVKRAVSKLFAMKGRSFRICLFVDGVDEFDGDYLELAAFLVSLATKDIKVVVSSRPITECYEAFGECQTLRLEYLTDSDIRTYVDGELAGNSDMSELMRANPQETKDLIQEICAMASGVFLWVNLAVQSLLRGLSKGDNISDLNQRLKELPPDLIDLYQHMISRLEPLYRQQAAEYFTLMKVASEITDRPLEALDLFYASAGAQECLKSSVLKMDQATAIKHCETIEKRLRSRSCGLLELHQPPPPRALPSAVRAQKRAWTGTGLPLARLQYLHRSVAEFVHQDHVWSQVFGEHGKDNRRNMYEGLSHAYVARLNRVGPRNQLVYPTFDDVKACLVAVLHCEYQYERQFARSQDEIVDELAAFMPAAWDTMTKVYMIASNADMSAVQSQWSEKKHLFVLAASCGLNLYVRSKLAAEKNFTELWPAYIPHLWPLFDRHLPMHLSPARAAMADVIEVLLEFGADPNRQFEGQSFWEKVMALSKSASPSDAPLFKQILASCARASATLSVDQGAQASRKIMNELPKDHGSPKSFSLAVRSTTSRPRSFDERSTGETTLSSSFGRPHTPDAWYREQTPKAIRQPAYLASTVIAESSRNSSDNESTQPSFETDIDRQIKALAKVTTHVQHYPISSKAELMLSKILTRDDKRVERQAQLRREQEQEHDDDLASISFRGGQLTAEHDARIAKIIEEENLMLSRRKQNSSWLRFFK